ncbi:PEP-CTERM sorting domain-containing protein [Anabaena sp. PCC 7108]|uniref:PEP-CTERM sorting domain-containing protein n=1 Tax=Anabaena sp. PCC 7108 TaxID=163908 RepID=UPI00035C4B52|nr:PEP-CTERM sorting domain-containing protein [Anabaena sp. PCC 7108]
MTTVNVLQKLSMATAGAAVITLGLAANAQAASINRSDFNPDAVNFDFASSAPSSTVATDGNLTVTNGVVLNIGSYGSLNGNTYYDGNDASVIRFDFLNPVSAFGLDFAANNADITLSIFDNVNNLIESLTLDWTTLPGSPFATGFIGLNAGSNSIAYATIDTPLNGNELYVDNLIYQYQSSPTSVPEPASLIGILGLGAFGVTSLRKRKQTAAVKA